MNKETIKVNVSSLYGFRGGLIPDDIKINHNVDFLQEHLKEINKLLEELKYNIPQDYVRSCDTAGGIGYYEDDEYSWQYQLYRYIIDLQNRVEKLTGENQDLEERIDYLSKQLEKKYEKVGTLTNELLYEENKHLQSVIDKAIHFIETCNPDVNLDSMFLNESYISNYGACELLEILRSKNE